MIKISHLLRLSVFILFFILFSFSCFSQKILLRGQVFDGSTNSSLSSVSINALNSKEAVITNELGSFSIFVDSLPCRLIFSFIGFKNDTVSVLNYNEELKIILHPQTSLLPDVIVGDEAPFLISMATAKGYKNWNKTQFSKALYRQFDKEGDKLTTFKEILLNIMWFPGAVSAINVEGARYAEGDKGNVAIEMTNFSHYSYLFSGYIFVKEWAKFMTPLTKDSRHYYKYAIERYIETSNDTIAVIKCSPVNKLKELSYFSGYIYIGKKGYDVYKIDGLFEGLGLLSSGGGLSPKVKDDILKLEVNFKPGNDSSFVFSNCKQHLTFKVKYGPITLQKVDISSQLINYSNITPRVPPIKYTQLSLNLNSADDLKIAKDESNYNPQLWNNNPAITYTPEESDLIKKLEKEKKVKGNYFKVQK